MLNIESYQAIRENASHFTGLFPYNTYLCSIPYDFASVPLHWHDDTEFIYIKKGQGIIHVGASQTHVKAGDIALILPGTIHGILQDNDAKMEYENIIFDSKILDNSLDDTYETYLAPLFCGQIDLPIFFKPGVSGYDSVKKYLDISDNISAHQVGGWGIAIKGNLMLLFFDLVNLYEGKAAKGQSRHIDRLKPVLKYIEDNYASPVAVADLASLLGFSQSHFMRFFKESLGVSCITYLNDYRLSMAARLLLSTEDSVLAISEQTGFENLSHFNRLFKKKYNKTPREYRN